MTVAPLPGPITTPVLATLGAVGTGKGMPNNDRANVGDGTVVANANDVNIKAMERMPMENGCWAGDGTGQDIGLDSFFFSMIDALRAKKNKGTHAGMRGGEDVEC